MEIAKKLTFKSKNIFRYVISGIVFSAILYLNFMSLTIYNAYTREQSEKAIVSIEADIANLEVEYSALKSDVTKTLAQARGFQDISSAIYITRKLIGKILTLNNDI